MLTISLDKEKHTFIEVFIDERRSNLKISVKFDIIILLKNIDDFRNLYVNIHFAS
jgi:hypothetical protein